MGNTLGLTVVAEGVKTQAQLNFLGRHHCDVAQGYYFHRPSSGEDFSQWLHKHMPGKFRMSQKRIA